MEPRLRRLLPVMLVVAAGAGALACSAPEIDVAALSAASVAGERSRILAESSHYTWSAYAPAQVAADALLPNGRRTPPSAELSLPTLSSAQPHVNGNRLIGRIRTNGPWARMGLDSGVNYVWRDSLAGQVTPRVLIIPHRAGPPMFWLEAQDGGYLGTHAPGTRLLVSSQCVVMCEDGCPAGHCGRDTTRSAWSVADTVDIHTDDTTAAPASRPASPPSKIMKAYMDSLHGVRAARKSDPTWAAKPRKSP